MYAGDSATETHTDASLIAKSCTGREAAGFFDTNPEKSRLLLYYDVGGGRGGLELTRTSIFPGRVWSQKIPRSPVLGATILLRAHARTYVDVTQRSGVDVTRVCSAVFLQLRTILRSAPDRPSLVRRRIAIVLYWVVLTAKEFGVPVEVTQALLVRIEKQAN